MAEKVCNLVKSGGGIVNSSQIQWGATASDWYQYSVYDNRIVFLTINIATARSTGKLFDVPSSIKPLVNAYAVGGTSSANIGTVGVLNNGEVDVWSSSLSGASVSFTYVKA